MSNVSLQKEKKVGIVASCKDTHVFATEFNESLYNVYASLCHYGEPKKVASIIKLGTSVANHWKGSTKVNDSPETKKTRELLREKISIKLYLIFSLFHACFRTHLCVDSGDGACAHNVTFRMPYLRAILGTQFDIMNGVSVTTSTLQKIHNH